MSNRKKAKVRRFGLIFRLPSPLMVTSKGAKFFALAFVLLSSSRVTLTFAYSTYPTLIVNVGSTGIKDGQGDKNQSARGWVCSRLELLKTAAV